MSHADIFSEGILLRILRRKLLPNTHMAPLRRSGDGTFTNDASTRRALAAA
jgi:hypothetical protein